MVYLSIVLEAVKGLLSKKRGKASNHQIPDSVKELAVELIKREYVHFGPTLAREKLVKDHQLNISVTSIRSLMISKGLWIEKKKKKTNIHQLRERRSKEGELEQVDTSPHAWFEERAPKCGLHLSVDDATSKIMSGDFAPVEALWPYFELFFR